MKFVRFTSHVHHLFKKKKIKKNFASIHLLLPYLIYPLAMCITNIMSLVYSLVRPFALIMFVTVF